jgi:hypothetical protein
MQMYFFIYITIVPGACGAAGAAGAVGNKSSKILIFFE